MLTLERIWRDAIMGVITGDALGCPVQFKSREAVAKMPVTTMTGYGTFHMPRGTWTDDGSMTLATLDSITQKKGIDPEDLMDRFSQWMYKGQYTPYGKSFDIGIITMNAIDAYRKNRDVQTCGNTAERSNGNGSLMRIMPVCLYLCRMQAAGKMTDQEALDQIHLVSGLTHNHIRSRMACGLYYFMVRSLLAGNGTLRELLQKGVDDGAAFYKKELSSAAELAEYARLLDLYAFQEVPVSDIKSSGYVVDTLEAAVWCLLKTGTFRDALLTAVNLGEDTDTVGAVCGGLAGLYYGYEEIPADWLKAIARRDWIEELCFAGAKMIETL